mgnify:CR=1 FL=1
MKTFRNFVAGAWVEPSTGDDFDNVLIDFLVAEVARSTPTPAATTRRASAR